MATKPSRNVSSNKVDVLSGDHNFNFLSVRDLLAARDLYHVHLVHKANVVATAVGRYLIRKSDPWPGKDSKQKSGKGVRTLGNSEVRDYSWPCILVFVDQWVNDDAFGGKLRPEDKVPPALYLPDGKIVPVCVVEAKKDESFPGPVSGLMFPQSVIGGGYPVLLDVQGEEHVGSVGCLVTDGHLVYALTCRHVSGQEGEPIFSVLDGERQQVGTSSALQLSRERFNEVYPGLPGNIVFVNLDAGLIEIEDRQQWTSRIYGIGELGELANVDIDNLSLKLIGAEVCAYGAVSRRMDGIVHALFYRYKELAGSEYIADYLIGAKNGEILNTHPGDSGTLWLLKQGFRPLAIQWGGHVFMDGGKNTKAPYALATSLSTVCDALEVDIVRDWGIGLPEYWGALGHYEIANQATTVISNASLRKLMANNLDRITFDEADITSKNLSGLSKQPFVPLADVPDLVWKIGKYNRGQPEHPNHFADMDKPRPGDEKTLLDLCKESLDNVSVDVWLKYYNDVQDESKGLLPFRVWQFYQQMVAFVKAGKAAEFVCAAGIVSHYVGDACQPLHISYMFNGDPNDEEMGTVRDRKTGAKSQQMIPKATGVHSAYEDAMVNQHAPEIKAGVSKILAGAERLSVYTGGKGAADAVVGLMQATFTTIKPKDIVDEYMKLKGQKPAQIAQGLWEQFGDKTIEVMASGSLYLANLWDSAWKEGGGNIDDLAAIDQATLEKLYQDRTFMTSYTLDRIKPVLEGTAPVALAAMGKKPAKVPARGKTRPRVLKAKAG